MAQFDAHPPADRGRSGGLLEPVEEGSVGRDEVHPGSDQGDVAMPEEEVPLLGEALRVAGVAAVETGDEGEVRGGVRDPGAQCRGDAAVARQLDEP